MSNFKDTNIMCPCFCRQETKKLHCEGVVDGSHTHLAFDTAALKNAHMERRCNSIFGYLKCPIYSAVSKRYGGDGNE